MEYWRVAPHEYKTLISLQLRVAAGLDPKLSALVLLLVSQINGCAFCVELHAQEARKRGETERRIAALPDWRDTSFFSTPERAALEWAERVTNLRDGASLDVAYEALVSHFSEQQIVLLTFSISLMNAMNRVAIGLRSRAEPDAPS